MSNPLKTILLERRQNNVLRIVWNCVQQTGLSSYPALQVNARIKFPHINNHFSVDYFAS